MGKIEEADEWYNRGVALQDKEKYEEAIVCYDNAIKLNPKNSAAPRNNKGNSLYALEKYEEAITCCDNAIKLNPKNLAAYNGKGNSLRKLGRDEDGEQCFAKAKELEES